MIHTDYVQAVALIPLLLENGRTVSVYDGEEWALKRSTDAAAIFAAMATTDADTLRVREADGEHFGTFWLVYGNGPGELIADHSDSAAVNVLWDHWAALVPQS